MLSGLPGSAWHLTGILLSKTRMVGEDRWAMKLCMYDGKQGYGGMTDDKDQRSPEPVCTKIQGQAPWERMLITPKHLSLLKPLQQVPIG